MLESLLICLMLRPGRLIAVRSNASVYSDVLYFFIIITSLMEGDMFRGKISFFALNSKK